MTSASAGAPAAPVDEVPPGNPASDSQERDALTIELTVRQGRTLEARSLARTVLSKHPQSPHAAEVRRVLETAGQD